MHADRHRYTTEQKIKRWEEEDALHAAEERREFRESLLSNERNKKAETIRINHEITQKWKDTQMVKRDRVKADVQYEMAVQKIEHLKTIHRRQEAALEERKEIDLFEKNMKKMGIGGDADGIRLSVSYEAPELLEQRLKATLKAKEPSSEEIQSFVEQLKERTAEKRAARYEKARRRRRALTSTNNASTSAPDHVPS